MALILCVETTSLNCSVAVSQDGQAIASRDHQEAQFSHAENLSVFINEVIEESKMAYADLDAVCISSGPGSYTGLRIGTSTAKGICFALDIPLIALNTLAIMTNHIQKEVQADLYVPMVDARRMEVFTGKYNRELEPIGVSAPMVLDEHSFSEDLKTENVLFFGSGAAKFNEICSHANARFNSSYVNRAIHMTGLAELALKNSEFEDLAYFEPNYIKGFVATVPKAKLNQ
ncbi:MAG: tRNA (adenosine(37)-N6)-threonylcarbamoyltransferase complex dimerization subunit type 1 TsaB [Bacteroidota bacterium]